MFSELRFQRAGLQWTVACVCCLEYRRKKRAGTRWTVSRAFPLEHRRGSGKEGQEDTGSRVERGSIPTSRGGVEIKDGIAFAGVFDL